MGRHHDDDDGRERDEEKKSERKRRREKKSSSRKREERKSSRKRDRDDDERRRRRDHSDSDSSYLSSDRDRKRRKKHRKKKERMKHKKRSRKEEKRREDSSDSERLERNYGLADALHALLELQPGMASELPVLLIRMAEGTSFNLNQMPDARVSLRLQRVLASLKEFGVEQDDGGSWTWKAPGGGGGNRDPLILLRIIRTLLDQVGVTMEAVENYGKDPVVAEPIRNENETQKVDDTLATQTTLLLGKFQKGKTSEGPSLAQELASLCNMILEGESIGLAGLADEALRGGIEQLFSTAGLEKSEMEDSDDEEDKDEGEPAMGYGLPDENESQAVAKMQLILEACEANDSKPRVKGPTLMPSRNDTAQYMDQNDTESDDDEGPAPIGSEKAKARVQKGPTLPPEVVKAMAARRKREMDTLTTGMEPQTGEITEREEWMMEPGEHEFLQGIKSGAPIKSRGFQNKKQSAPVEAAAAPVDPAVQAEMDAIMELHREARGPSLVEQHRLKKAEEKAQKSKGGKEEWKWSRDKDLDAGRRVDKNALNMVMGGAAGNLKEKFQGGYSRGFM